MKKIKELKFKNPSSPSNGKPLKHAALRSRKARVRRTVVQSNEVISKLRTGDDLQAELLRVLEPLNHGIVRVKRDVFGRLELERRYFQEV